MRRHPATLGSRFTFVDASCQLGQGSGATTTRRSRACRSGNTSPTRCCWSFWSRLAHSSPPVSSPTPSRGSNWPGRSIAFVLLLATMMLPSQVTMIPGFLIWKSLHWYNTLNPLWVPSFFGSAFFIFLMTQHMRTIPNELEEAARIDGLNAVQSWYYIILPNVKPTLAAIAILLVHRRWNEFMGPLIYLRDQTKFPLSLGLYGLGLLNKTNAADYSWSRDHGRQHADDAAGDVGVLPVPAVLCAGDDADGDEGMTWLIADTGVEVLGTREAGTQDPDRCAGLRPFRRTPEAASDGLSGALSVPIHFPATTFAISSGLSLTIATPCREGRDCTFNSHTSGLRKVCPATLRTPRSPTSAPVALDMTDRP